MQTWNSLSKYVWGQQKAQQLSGAVLLAQLNKSSTLSEVDLEDARFSSTYQEFDRVLGGGIVPGSAILIGGSPGAGKYVC